MATSKFSRGPKMMTTEPSVDEVGKGMKRGGHAKKHMAKGGEMESRAEERKEEREIKGIKKELKHHENEKASKAHRGLKNGGRAPKAGPNVMGGLAGGLEATRRNPKKMTEGVEGPGYKNGGKMCSGGKMAKGGEVIGRSETKTTLKPKINVKDKVTSAKQIKSFNTKSGGVEGLGYKKGGTVSDSVAGRYKDTLVCDGEKMPNRSGKTGKIKQSPAGYKEGGHVLHSKQSAKCHENGGHVSYKEHMACGGQAHKMGSTKTLTAKKAGGKCNY